LNLFPGEGRGPVSMDLRRHPVLDGDSRLGAGLRRGTQTLQCSGI